jgi:hypothetical protein
MKLPKLFIYILLIVPFLGSYHAASAQDKRDPEKCRNFEMKLDVKNSKGALEISVSGGNGLVRYHLLEDRTGELVSPDRNQKSFEGLNPGKYTVVVKDQSGCSLDEEFEIR